MSKNRDWLPRKREDQLAMAKQWRGALLELGPDSHPYSEAWGVPEADMDDLALLIANAEDTLIRVKNTAARTHVTVVECNEAFKALVAKMRYIKKRFFYVPPLTNADLARLGLNPADMEPTKEHIPTTVPEIEFAVSVIRQLSIRYRDFGARSWTKPDHVHSVDIRWAVLDSPPSAVEALVNVDSKSSGPLVLEFGEGERGKRVYAAARWVNNTMHHGPWSDIESGVIP